MLIFSFQEPIALSFFEEGGLFDFVVALLGTLLEVYWFVRIVAASAEVGLSPGDGHAYAASAAVAAALDIFVGVYSVVFYILHEFLYFDVFFFVVVFETLESSHPSFLDELIVAGELPGDLFGGIFGGEIVVHVHDAVPDIFFFHHVFGIELDGEEGGVEIELVDVFDVDDVDGAFG